MSEQWEKRLFAPAYVTLAVGVIMGAVTGYYTLTARVAVAEDRIDKTGERIAETRADTIDRIDRLESSLEKRLDRMEALIRSLVELRRGER